MPSSKKVASKKATKKIQTLSLSKIKTEIYSNCCEKSALILRHAHDSSSALLKAYSLAREVRGSRRGMTTDQEQDLLRAMLVMATAGLDAMIKQLIRDALPQLLRISDQALNTFEKFIARRLVEDPSSSEKMSANKFLARVLSRPSPQEQLIEEYIQDLTKGSLQSSEALFQVAAALGVDPPQAGIDPNALGPIFHIRNRIVHELDIDLSANRRNRHVRSQTTMIRDTNQLINLSAKILALVNDTISSEVS